MGLANYNYIGMIHEKRKSISERYDEKLSALKATKPTWHQESNKNYAYYPVLFESSQLLLKCMDYLKQHEIYSRRYFYPSLAKVLPYVEHVNLNITDDVSERILCLPLYVDLSFEEVDLIARLLLRAQNN